MKKQIRIVISDEIHNWIDENIKDVRYKNDKSTFTPFRWRIEYMLSNGIKPPVFNTKTNEHSVNVSITYLALENIRHLNGTSWADKFKTFIGCSEKTVRSSPYCHYISDDHQKKLEQIGNGNASAGIRTLCDRSLTISESQRDALELLGGGSVEEGLKVLIGE